MRAIFILSAGAFLLSFGTSAQQLTMYSRFGGAHFEYAKDTSVFQVSPRQVLQIMKDDPASREEVEFKKARTQNSIAGLLGFAGGFMLAFPVGTAVAGGEPEWGLAAGGAALILASIPLTISYKRHAQHAIDEFNKNHSAFRPKPQLFWSGLQAGVVIRF